MKQLVEKIVKSIVNDPESVVVEERESVDFPGLTIINIQVNGKDTGQLIGKRGRTINAIRDIVTIAAIRAQKRVKVMVKEDETVVKDETKATSFNDMGDDDLGL